MCNALTVTKRKGRQFTIAHIRQLPNWYLFLIFATLSMSCAQCAASDCRQLATVDAVRQVLLLIRQPWRGGGGAGA